MTISTTRRTLLAGAAAAAATPFAALAQGANDLKGTTVVFASWGGAYQDAEKASYCEPFEKATGAKVVQDGPMNPAKFRAMAASGAPDWDVADITGGFLEVGIKDGLFEKIDTKLVNTGRIDPRFVSEYGVGCIVWSSNLGFSTTAFPNGAPKTWADLFDLKKFPGKRTLQDSPTASLEVALLADGVAPDKLYPIDLDRAFAKLDTIKSSIVWWGGGAQSQQLLASGETPVGMFWNGRVQSLQKSGAPVAISWEQNLTAADMLVVPKGTKNKAAAMSFLATATSAKAQADFATEGSYTPTNLKSVALMDKEAAASLPGNYSGSGITLDMAYWAANRDEIGKRWYAWQAK
jgi:putative spermidine/putrescine transport system substrate-binding protein